MPQGQWQDFALQLAEEVLHSGREELYAEICARENWHQRLMDYVNRGLDIRTLREYEDMLLASHRQEVIDFYIRYICHVMEGYRCRATYKEVCRYLRHINILSFACAQPPAASRWRSGAWCAASHGRADGGSREAG